MRVLVLVLVLVVSDVIHDSWLTIKRIPDPLEAEALEVPGVGGRKFAHAMLHQR